MITASNPALTTAASNVITVVTTGVVPTANLFSTASQPNPTAYPDVYGPCNGPSAANTTYTFSSIGSANAITETATFFNEVSQTVSASNQSLLGAYFFSAAQANYTITVKAVSASGVVSTKAYQLINNRIALSITSIGNNTFCLTGGSAPVSFAADYTSATGFQLNYPGDLYTYSWGDGTPSSVFTLAQLIAAGGFANHNYTQLSCGKVTAIKNNVFEVDLKASNKYCGQIGTPTSSYANIVINPTNFFKGPALGVACTNTAVTFTNGSIPGPDPNASAATCQNNPNAKYNWSVDGVPVPSGTGLLLNQSFTYTFTTKGMHTVLLQADPSNSGCPAQDYSATICVQDPPTASFTIPAGPVCSTSPLTPVNTSTVDAGCSPPTYQWSISPATYTLAAGSSLTTATPPTINFTAAGTYTIKLTITPTTCNPSTATQTIVVDTPPTVALAATSNFCGAAQTLTFDNTAGSPTQVTYSGSATTPTYLWTVTPPAGGSYTFTGGTGPSSQYPQIQFNGAGNYSVSVVATNSCGPSATQTQTINLQQAPIVSAGVAQAICQGTNANLAATITGTYNSLHWSSPTAGTFGNAANLTTTYTPSAADIANGSVTLTLSVATGLTGACATVTSQVTITIIPTDHVTSAAAEKICSGSNVNYTITASDPASTYSWTATVTSGAATGFSASGTSATINDVIVNSNLQTDAVITYTITPTSSASSCPGIPFTFTVTIPATPTITTNGANATICSGTQTGLSFTSNQAGTKYTWTVAMPAGVSGGNNVVTPTTTAGISDVLTNTTTTTAAVTYTVTAYNSTGCAGTPFTVTVNVAPAPTTANAGPNQTLCGSTTTSLAANTPTVGTGLWTVISGTGVTFTDNSSPTSVITGLVAGNSYRLQWTITSGTGCSSSSVVNITVVAATVGGTTAAVGSSAVCAPTNSGQITLTGQTGNILRWESSVDGGTTWQAIAVTSATLNFSNLTQTTQYHAIVQNGSCAVQTSTATTITVNQSPPAANAGADQNVCNAATITLGASNPGSYTGVWTQTSGPAANIANVNDPNTTVSGLTGGNTYTFLWTIQASAPCVSTTSQVKIIDAPLSNGGTSAAVGANTVCSGSNGGQITLTGYVGGIISWQSSTDNGTTWTTLTETVPTISYSNLTQTTIYRAVVQSGLCSTAVSTQTTITVNQSPPIANAGMDQSLCGVTTATLAGNNSGTYTGVWTQVAGPAVTIVNPNNPQTAVNGLVNGNTYTFIWTIDASAPCVNSQAQVNITVTPQTVGGTTASANGTSVCAGTNSGQVNLTGQVGNIIRWESSVDNGTTWQPIANNNTFITFTNLTQTMQYRAVVQSGTCLVQNSSVTTITVNPQAPIADAGPNQILCNASTTTLNAANPGNFTGVWQQTSGPAVTFANANNPQTTVSGLVGGNTYVFNWTIQAQAPCTNTQSQVTITDNPDVVASYTKTPISGCGNLTVQFTNTSNNQTGTNFLWNFGDGSSSTSLNPQHTFAQRNDGRDTVYHIGLSVPGNCATRAPYLDSVLVRPAIPIAQILPVNPIGCGNFTLDVRNVSPGNNLSYDFYLYNGATLVQKITKTDKSDAIFNPISTKVKTQFILYMIATGYCNNTGQTIQIPITISPSTVVAQMFTQNSVNSGCVPLTLTFLNNSFGGDTFHYNIYDSNGNILQQPIAALEPLPYTFSTAGTYYVTITATNSCGTQESPRTQISVYPLPVPAFTANDTTGCKDVVVTFANNTVSNDPNTPASSLSYDWDFGDGSPHSASFQPTHSFNSKASPYTVTLTVTNNATGCSNVTSRVNYIHVEAPPGTQFIAEPDSVISIPSYKFSFVDKTSGSPVSWKWTFSDGQVSTLRNPQITFADTGKYKVTLTTTNKDGCDSTVTHTVQITGVPGQLYLPNAFIPTSATSELRIFMAKGSGIKSWHLQIFNGYGALVWETTRLDGQGAPIDGWDGTYKGVPAPQGVYVWQAEATFINGTEWKGNSYNNSLPKRVGTIHLIR